MANEPTSSAHTLEDMARVALRNADMQVKKVEDENQALFNEHAKDLEDLTRLWQETDRVAQLLEDRHAVESERAMLRLEEAQAEQVKAKRDLENAERKVRQNLMGPFTKRSRSRHMASKGPAFHKTPVRPHFAPTPRGSMPPQRGSVASTASSSVAAMSMPSSSSGSMPSAWPRSSPSSLVGATPQPQPWETGPESWETMTTECWEWPPQQPSAQACERFPLHRKPWFRQSAAPEHKMT